MTRGQALDRGFCEHCAAFVAGRPLCGMLKADKTACLLDAETQERWVAEHGLEIKNRSKRGTK